MENEGEDGGEGEEEEDETPADNQDVEVDSRMKSQVVDTVVGQRSCDGSVDVVSVGGRKDVKGQKIEKRMRERLGTIRRFILKFTQLFR